MPTYPVRQACSRSLRAITSGWPWIMLFGWWRKYKSRARISSSRSHRGLRPTEAASFLTRERPTSDLNVSDPSTLVREHYQRGGRHRKGTGEQFTFSRPDELFIVRSGARVEVADH
jgi:hypothetical protein